MCYTAILIVRCSIFTLHFLDVIPDTPLKQIHVEGTCACGCIVTNSSGEIIGTGRCKGLAEWNIRVDEGHLIKLSFQYFNLLVDEQRLRVRDGGLNGDLLGQSYGIIKLTEITSSSNKLFVQLMTRYNASIPLLYHRQRAITGNARERHRFNKLYSYGFIASYTIEGNFSMTYSS